MLKLMKYELIKQRTSKVIIGAILALLEVAFLAGMLLGKEEIMAIAAGMLTFLASVTFVIVGLEEIITYYHDLRDKSGYMLFMTPYNVYEIMGSKILTGFFSIAAAAIIFGIIGFADITMVCAKYGELQTLFDQMKALFSFTLQMNVDGMLPFENMVADYIKETGSHVMYRVTPVFSGDDLVAQGVQMEAYSVEDDGDGICFNVFCYNVQPGVTIDYADGTNHLSDKDAQTDSSSTSTDTASAHYVLNTSSKKYHDPSCSAVGKMSEKNRRDFTGTQAELEKEGYTPHTSCIQ